MVLSAASSTLLAAFPLSPPVSDHVPTCSTEFFPSTKAPVKLPKSVAELGFSAHPMVAVIHFAAEQSPLALPKTAKTFSSRPRRKNHPPTKTSRRIPQICRLLDERQTPCRFETGLAAVPQFLFHSIRQGDDCWRILAGWDVILLASDHEGISKVILKGMILGVLPVVPKIAPKPIATIKASILAFAANPQT